MTDLSHELVIERSFDAPVEKVWKAWTVPELAKRWWGPKNFTAPVITMDFRVGGKYLFCMRGKPTPDAPEQDFWSTGVYKEIIPMKKIVSSDSFADEAGNVVPASHYGMNADFPLELTVTVSFVGLDGDRTRMILQHSGMPAGEDSVAAEAGWNSSFDKLAQTLASNFLI
jgi:uncharacterized protein YndB with AHSA1/START domain